MKAKIVFPVTLLALVGLIVLLILIPSNRSQDGPETLPWMVSVDAQGRSHAFGLTLGETPLSEAQRRLRDAAKLNLFAGHDGTLAVEAYFQEVSLHSLRAKMVITLAATADELKGFYERGVRITTSGGGDKRVTLSDADTAAAMALPVHQITYLPASRLDPEVIARRFGEPAEQVRDAEGVTHWLYPAKGVDVGADDDGKTVIQYSSPGEFEAIRSPLQAADQEGAQQE